MSNKLQYVFFINPARVCRTTLDPIANARYSKTHVRMDTYHQKPVDATPALVTEEHSTRITNSSSHIPAHHSQKSVAPSTRCPGQTQNNGFVSHCLGKSGSTLQHPLERGSWLDQSKQDSIVSWQCAQCPTQWTLVEALRRQFPTVDVEHCQLGNQSPTILQCLLAVLTAARFGK